MTRKMISKVSFIVISVLTAVFIFWLNAYETSAASLSARIGSMSLTKKKVKTLQDLKFKNIVRQTKDYSCGAAALSTIMTYYFGKEASEDTILEHILSEADKEKKDKVIRKGVSLLDLKKSGEAFGYKGGGYRVPAHLLDTLDRPAIALVNYRGYSHFVVLKGVHNNRVFVADPARGNLVWNLKKFTRMWNGILLVFSDPSSEKIESHSLEIGLYVKRKNKLSFFAQSYFPFVVGPAEF